MPFVIQAAEPSTAPILRFDAGMHTAKISHIATDSLGRLALTASKDKTARLWALPDGKSKSVIASPSSQIPLRTFHIPVGSDEEGRLDACALSPDGMVAALGGFTGKRGGSDMAIYLFDTVSGRLLHRLGGLADVVQDLAFSDSGRFLAAICGSGEGLHLYDCAMGRELGRDRDYNARSTSVDWHGDEWLVTTCWDGRLNDGRVRMYHPGLTSSASGRAINLKPARIFDTLPHGFMPNSARFSPDGSLIAIGFYDSTTVIQLDAATLSLQFATPTVRVGPGGFGAVAWSLDGKTLARISHTPGG